MKPRYADDELQRLIDAAKISSSTESSTESPSSSSSELWKSAARFSENTFGSDHARTTYCYNELGVSLVANSSFEEAIAILSARVEKVQAIHGDVHYAVEHMNQSLARAYQGTGNLAKQSACWLAAATSSEQRKGLTHSTSLYCYHQAARSLFQLDELDAALRILKSIFEATQQNGGKQLRLAYIARDIARCLDKQSKFEESVGWWQIAVALFSNEPKSQANILRKSEASMCEAILRVVLAAS